MASTYSIAVPPVSINALPKDILEKIYGFLPLEDRVVVCPRISRIWKEVSEEKQDFQELAASLLPFSRLQEGNDEQNQMIIQLAKNNNLISMISRYGCSLGRWSSAIYPVRITSRMQELQGLSLRSQHHSYDGYSERFKVSWNPRTLQLSNGSGSCGDFRAFFSIAVHVLKLHARTTDYPLTNQFSLAVSLAERVEKKRIFSCGGFCSWNEVSHESVRPAGLDQSLSLAFNLKIKMHATYLVYSNVNFLENMPTEILRNLATVGISFKCNQYGRIMSYCDANRGADLTLKIAHEIAVDRNDQNPKGMPILYWTSSNHSEFKERCTTPHVQTILCWSVFATTVEKFAQKLGIDFEARGS